MASAMAECSTTLEYDIEEEMMERLTEKHEADAQRKEYERRLANGYPRNIPEERFLRLAAYEDTGLEPKQCENAKVIIESAFSDDTSKAERIRELLKADKDGRLVVLPCEEAERALEAKQNG